MTTCSASRNWKTDESLHIYLSLQADIESKQLAAGFECADSLRHTKASLLIAQGVDVRTVASLLGHAQASTTLDIYAHAFDKNKRKAQEKLGKAIGL